MRKIICLVLMSFMTFSISAIPYNEIECLVLELAIDNAATGGEAELADQLFGMYERGGCWPFC